jgi:hypothetical protein
MLRDAENQLSASLNTDVIRSQIEHVSEKVFNFTTLKKLHGINPERKRETVPSTSHTHPVEDLRGRAERIYEIKKGSLNSPIVIRGPGDPSMATTGPAPETGHRSLTPMSSRNENHRAAWRGRQAMNLRPSTTYQVLDYARHSSVAITTGWSAGPDQRGVTGRLD